MSKVVVKKSPGKFVIKDKKGALHKDMGVPQGKPISTEKLEKADKDASPKEKKRITFAENARKWNHK